MREAIAAALFVCGCGIGDFDPGTRDVGGGGTGGDDVPHEASSGNGRGGDAPCGRPVHARQLRQVRAIDSRGLEADTLVLAAVPEPQTFWLPSASEHAGAIVIVKEVNGSDRRVTVLTTGADVFHNDGSTEHDANDAWSSRTFIATEDESDAFGWVIVDAMK